MACFASRSKVPGKAIRDVHCVATPSPNWYTSGENNEEKEELMGSVTVKIPAEAHAKLAALAGAEKRPMGELLADLIEREDRRAFLEAANDDLARLKADPEAWADYQEESRLFEGAIMDGLEDEPWVE
jgi:hypothetical protein